MHCDFITNEYKSFVTGLLGLQLTSGLHFYLRERKTEKQETDRIFQAEDLFQTSKILYRFSNPMHMKGADHSKRIIIPSFEITVGMSSLYRGICSLVLCQNGGHEDK